MVGWLEFNVPFQHKYGYIRDDAGSMQAGLAAAVSATSTRGEGVAPL